jgi:hypothetical protein
VSTLTLFVDCALIALDRSVDALLFGGVIALGLASVACFRIARRVEAGWSR